MGVKNFQQGLICKSRYIFFQASITTGLAWLIKTDINSCLVTLMKLIYIFLFCSQYYIVLVCGLKRDSTLAYSLIFQISGFFCSTCTVFYFIKTFLLFTF